MTQTAAVNRSVVAGEIVRVPLEIFNGSDREVRLRDESSRRSGVATIGLPEVLKAGESASAILTIDTTRLYGQQIFKGQVATSHNDTPRLSVEVPITVIANDVYTAGVLQKMPINRPQVKRLITIDNIPAKKLTAIGKCSLPGWDIRRRSVNDHKLVLELTGPTSEFAKQHALSQKVSQGNCMLGSCSTTVPENVLEIWFDLTFNDTYMRRLHIRARGIVGLQWEYPVALALNPLANRDGKSSFQVVYYPDNLGVERPAVQVMDEVGCRVLSCQEVSSLHESEICHDVLFFVDPENHEFQNRAIGIRLTSTDGRTMDISIPISMVGFGDAPS